MSNSKLKIFKQELQTFNHAMLVTRRGSGDLRSRPMQIAGLDDRGHLWFITSIGSGKVEELTECPSVNVALQDGQRFMSVSGTVRVTRDPAAVRKFWTESQSIWFELGRDDPELVLLEIVPTYAEYWDRTGLSALKFLLFESTAMISGTTLTGNEAPHEKIKFPDVSGRVTDSSDPTSR